MRATASGLARAHSHKTALSADSVYLALVLRRGRTRTVSLGSHCRCPLITCGDADLRPSGGVPVSDRELP